MMEIAVIREGIDDSSYNRSPWIVHRAALAKHGVDIVELDAGAQSFSRPYDAMLLHVWLDWMNRERFVAKRILPILARYAVYRAKFPQTVQIVHNHTDMARVPYATPYWRPGDPVLYRTPAYDRSELAPFPAESIWPYEMVWGEPAFRSAAPPIHKAGFIGTATGPQGYRSRVAEAVAKVGIGICSSTERVVRSEYNRLMASCEIMVCPRGWGEQSQRHWDTWLSGKPMLTDRECDLVEMIPGIRLQEGVHYLVYDDPGQIPDIVTEWTHPTRQAALKQIARNGQAAALGYDSLTRMVQFFERIRALKR